MSDGAPDTSIHRCGHVAIIGRPNVGKSTLINRLVGQKFSITSRKAQTTRHRLLGIKSFPGAQIIYVDTPGLHAGAGRALNRYMNRAASGALVGVDRILFLVEAGRWTEGDDHVLERLGDVDAPVIAAVNKVDKLSDKQVLLPFIDELSKRGNFLDVVPISALHGSNCERLEQVLVDSLPAGPALYDEEQFTDRSERFLAAELIREQLMQRLHQELPYALTVEIEEFKREKGLVRMAAIIWIERKGQKHIVIGKGGDVLKKVGTQSRRALEDLLGEKVFLKLWVKDSPDWSDNERALKQFGYDD